MEPGEEALRALLRRLSASADLVVVSAGGHEPSPAGLRWARATSGTFVVARQDRAVRDRASLAAEAFRQVGAEVRGAILTTPVAKRGGLSGTCVEGPRPAAGAAPEADQGVARDRGAVERGATQPT